LSGRPYSDVKILLVTNDSRVFKINGKGDPVPARDIYGGRFTEVRRFGERLGDKFETTLMIISGKYGLIDGSRSIFPYENTIETRGEIVDLEEGTEFLAGSREAMEGHDCTILLLPKEFIRFLLENGIFEIENTIIAVTSKDFEFFLESRSNCLFLERRGARLGRMNATTIIDFLEDLSKDV